MAHLLGTKYCIESLLHDIKDIQETVNDVKSRVGQVKYQSWKFPDRLSVDVDVNNLLDDYKYNDDEEEDNQVSHVMLYDLLIDRLVFLLQSFTHFNEVLLSTEYTNDHSKSPGKGSRSISAGLTAKKCWSRVTQVASAMQQLGKVIQKNRHIPVVIDVSQSASFSVTKENKAKEILNQSTGAKDKPLPVSRDILNRACQTDETSYVSCEICIRTQSCLYDVGKSVVKVCKSQGLPTSLEDYMTKQSMSSLLSIAELTRWKSLQSKDLSRIDRHMEGLMKTINPLKKELDVAKKKQAEDKLEVERVKFTTDKKLEEMYRERQLHEHRYKETDKLVRNQMMTIKAENKKLEEKISTLNVQISDFKDELLEKHRAMITSENERSKLHAEFMEGQQYKQDALRLKSEMFELNKEINENKEKLESTSAKLEKERNRSRTMQSHEQALQEKQNRILQRFADLTEECEEWKERAMAAEEEKEKIEEEMNEDRKARGNDEKKSIFNKENIALIQEEKSSMERRISDLQASINVLDERLHDANERERLLVSYPDLHKSHNISAIESSGDVLTDMRRQVEANQVRMDVLEKENKSLMKTLAKLSPSHEELIERQEEDYYHPQGVQLWKSPKKNFESNHNVSPDSDITLQFIGRGEQQYRPSSKASFSSNSTVSSPTLTRKKQQGKYDIKDKQISPSRSSFSIGPGKRRSNTPVSSHPTSGRSALLKPWM